MENEQYIWRNWAQNLHRWGLNHFVAALLGGFGPLNILLAQGLFVVQPLTRFIGKERQLELVARVLEDEQARDAFIEILAESSGD